MIWPDAIRLYLAFALPGLFAAPLLRRAFPALPDGGAAIARPIGWVLIAWVAWFLPSLRLAPYGTPLVVVATVGLAAAGGRIAWTDRAEWKRLLREQWRTIALGEVFAALVFATCVWQIQYNGDIHPLAERFMDYAILKRLEFTTAFPPTDSWMAGKTLVYYYYGYVLMDVLRRIAGMELRWFFNLAVAGVYASFALSLWGCGLALWRRRTAAFAALFCGAFVGNFEFARQILVRWWNAGVWRFDRLDWFRASRVIPGTINETPVFSMFWGDLHPYLIAFPVVGACLALSTATLRGETHPFDPARPRKDRALVLALFVLPLGALYPTNSWDFPTFVAIALGAIAIPWMPGLLARLREDWTAGQGAEARADGGTGTGAPARVAALATTLVRSPLVQVCAAVAVLSVLAYLPFHFGFGNQVGRGIRLAQRRSDAIPMMIHFGPWLAILAIWTLSTARDRGSFLRRSAPLLATALALVLYEVAGTAWIAGLVKTMAEGGGPLAVVARGLDHLLLRGLAFVLLVAVLWVLTEELDLAGSRTAQGAARALFAFAMLVVLVCEFAYVDDFYGGENERMNTIFKAYIQAWILLAVAASGLFLAAADAVRARTRKRLAWNAGLALGGGAVVAAGLAFPLLADYSRSNGFRTTRSQNAPTWDPQDLFRRKFPRDAAAVDWIEKNLPADVVILEADEHAYQWESRVATFTGRLGLIGWKNHESGWRNSWTDALERGEAVQKIYGAAELPEALALLRKFGIDYVYVGEIERDRRKYPRFSLGKFEALERVYGDGEVAIYKVPPSSN